MQQMATRLGLPFLLLTILLGLGGCAATDVLREFIGNSDGTPARTQPTSAPRATPTLAVPIRSEDPPAGMTSEPPAGVVPATPTVSTPVAAGTGLLTGTFIGTLIGDGDSEAPLLLELEQEGRLVAGTATLGEGLMINAGGFCGRFPVPASSFEAREELETADSRKLQTTTSVDVEGFLIPVDLTVTLAADGQTLTAEAILQTPALCANDPVLVGTLTRRGGGS
jgi:hypothetical protein